MFLEPPPACTAMPSLRRATLLCVALAVATLALGGCRAPEARANVSCDITTGPTKAITGAIGVPNPVADACDALTDPVLGAAGHALDPLNDLAGKVGQGIFAQITGWAADGAAWLLGEVLALTNETTTPNLLSPGFLRQYRQMAEIAVSLGLLMLIFAVLESLGRGESGLLTRVLFVNLPVAAIATSCAYVVVALLIAVSDGFSAQIAHHAGTDAHEFFSSAIEALGRLGSSGGEALNATTAPGSAQTGGAAGGAAAPLFVGFIAAILAALGAFMVWIELLMRDAAIYAVALFLPFALAASIWPRWSGAARRTAELIGVLVFSKFVIVAIIALAASLLAHGEGGVEQVLAGAALLGIACFAPFVLFRLIPFAESALGSAYSRQSAAGGTVRTSEIASAHMMRRAALSHWAESAKRHGGALGGEGGGSSGRAGRGRGPGGGGKGPASGGPSGQSPVGGGAAASPAAAGAAAAVAGTSAIARSAGGAAKRLAGSTGDAPAATSAGSGGSTERPAPPRPSDASSSGEGSAKPPSPTEADSRASASSRPAERPPRPATDLGTSGAAKPKEGS